MSGYVHVGYIILTASQIENIQVTSLDRQTLQHWAWHKNVECCKFCELKKDTIVGMLHVYYQGHIE